MPTAHGVEIPSEHDVVVGDRGSCLGHHRGERGEGSLAQGQRAPLAAALEVHADHVEIQPPRELEVRAEARTELILTGDAVRVEPGVGAQGASGDARLVEQEPDVLPGPVLAVVERRPPAAPSVPIERGGEPSSRGGRGGVSLPLLHRQHVDIQQRDGAGEPLEVGSGVARRVLAGGPVREPPDVPGADPGPPRGAGRPRSEAGAAALRRRPERRVPGRACRGWCRARGRCGRTCRRRWGAPPGRRRRAGAGEGALRGARRRGRRPPKPGSGRVHLRAPPRGVPGTGLAPDRARDHPVGECEQQPSHPSMVARRGRDAQANAAGFRTGRARSRFEPQYRRPAQRVRTEAAPRSRADHPGRLWTRTFPTRSRSERLIRPAGRGL